MGNSGQRSEQSRTARIDNQHSQHGAPTAIVAKTLLLNGLRFDFNEVGLAGEHPPAGLLSSIRHVDPLSPDIRRTTFLWWWLIEFTSGNSSASQRPEVHLPSNRMIVAMYLARRI